MKVIIFILCFFCAFLNLEAQTKIPAFKDGEMLKYKMSYSGFLRAGTAVLEVEETQFRGEKVFHATGKGWTSGMIKWFFEVNDNYQSYFAKDSVVPYLFKRKINEGGYKKHRITSFNPKYKTAYVQDFIKQTDTIIPAANIQDMLSSFYHLRNMDVTNIKTGDEIKLDMFLDAQVYPFKLRCLGREEIRSKFGKINTIKFRPLVQSGRIFKEEESVTIWITDDSNKIPIRMRASLAVGSLRAELEDFKGLAKPLMAK